MKTAAFCESYNHNNHRIRHCIPVVIQRSPGKVLFFLVLISKSKHHSWCSAALAQVAFQTALWWAITTWRVENDSACLGALALSIATSNESSMWDIWCCYNWCLLFIETQESLGQTHGHVDLVNSLGEFSIISVHIRHLIIVLANQIKLTFYYVPLSCVDIISRIKYIKHPYLNEENTSVAASLRFCSWYASLSLRSFRARRREFHIAFPMREQSECEISMKWVMYIYNIYIYIHIYIYTHIYICTYTDAWVVPPDILVVFTSILSIWRRMRKLTKWPVCCLVFRTVECLPHPQTFLNMRTFGSSEFKWKLKEPIYLELKQNVPSLLPFIQFYDTKTLSRCLYIRRCFPL